MSLTSLARSIASSSPRDQQRSAGVYPTEQIPLFDARYWYVNGNRNSDFTITTSGSTINAYCRSYYDNDFIGLIWEPVNNWSHPGRSALPYYDYSGVVWVFDIVLSDNMPVLFNIQNAPTFTITYLDGTQAFVPLFQFADNPSGRSARITFEFDFMTTGFIQNQTSVSPVNIKQIMLGLTTIYYDEQPTATRLAVPEDMHATITTVSVTGGAPFYRHNFTAPNSGLGVSTSYDDQHIQSPEKIVEDIVALGFNGFVNHYVGMSRYGNKDPYPAGGSTALRYIETAGNTLNEPTIKWHESLAAELAAAGLDTVWGISYETFSPFANPDYVQRDWDGNLGVTGYTPPSYLISPCIVDGMTYLKNVFVDFANIMAVSLPVKIQVGEPWWWWNTATRKPCVYDFPTKLKFNADTGLFAPDIPTVDDLTGIDVNDNTPIDIANDTLQQTWVKWLRDQLGESVLELRDAVKAAHPYAQVTALFFLPSILDPSVGIINIVNYPKAQYSSPNLDFFQTEAYDWIIKGEMTKAKQSATIPIDDLGYTASQVYYLAGFVPSPELAAAINFTVLNDKYKGELWARIMGSVQTMRDDYGVANQSIWAWPQVATDGFVATDGNWHEIGSDRKLLRNIRVDRSPNYILPAGVASQGINRDEDGSIP